MFISKIKNSLLFALTVASLATSVCHAEGEWCNYRSDAKPKRDLNSLFESKPFHFEGSALDQCRYLHREWRREECRAWRGEVRKEEEDRRYEKAKKECNEKIDALVDQGTGITAANRGDYECYDLQWHRVDDGEEFTATMGIMYTSPHEQQVKRDHECSKLKACFAENSRWDRRDVRDLQWLTKKSQELGCPGSAADQTGGAAVAAPALPAAAVVGDPNN